MVMVVVFFGIIGLDIKVTVVGAQGNGDATDLIVVVASVPRLSSRFALALERP
jgi:hypothetical protein